MSEANVLRGHKATLTNPNTSEKAKEHSRQVIEEIQGDDVESTPSGAGTGTIDGKDEGNVLRGHKAAINNPNVSEDAKEHSRQILEEHGTAV